MDQIVLAPKSLNRLLKIFSDKSSECIYRALAAQKDIPTISEGKTLVENWHDAEESYRLSKDDSAEEIFLMRRLVELCETEDNVYETFIYLTLKDEKVDEFTLLIRKMAEILQNEE